MKAQRIVPVLLIFAALLVNGSCNDKKQYCDNGTHQASITEVVLPPEGYIQEPMRIQVKIQAPNGCWSNLKVKLNKITAAEYQLKAYGDFESQGFCPQMTVTRDTTIVLTPDLTGTITFRVWEQVNQVKPLQVNVVEKGIYRD